MRRESEPQEDLIVPGRFTGAGVLALTAALALFAFLIVGPVIESNSHLEALEDLDNRERLERGLRMLCNTQQNISLLNAQLESKTREARNKVTPVAASLSCLEKLSPPFRAEHYLWTVTDGGAVSGAVAQAQAAIEPAIYALEAPDEAIRERAMRTLTALSDGLIGDHKSRIKKRLSERDRSPASFALRDSLGLPHPPEQPVIPAPALREELDMSAPDAGEDAALGARADMDADMGEEPGDDMDTDFQFGDGALRLQLPGLSPRPPARSGLRLDEPGLDARSQAPESGLLYRDDQATP